MLILKIVKLILLVKINYGFLRNLIINIIKINIKYLLYKIENIFII
jgi:hypothetical protein